MSVYPRMFRVRQTFERPRVDDIPGEVQSQFKRLGLRDKVRPGASVLMTNSAKYAHYGPGIIGVDSIFGSTAECVEAAVIGRAEVDDSIWR